MQSSGRKVLWRPALSTLLGAAAIAGTIAGLAGGALAQMNTGSGMKNFEAIFNVQSGQRLYDYDAILTASNAPGNIFYPGERPTFTFQLQNRLDKPITMQGKVDFLGYGTHGIPGDI